MSYIVDNLPPAGTMLLYRKANGKVYHRCIIDSGIIMSMCGIRNQLAARKERIPGLTISDPNKDELFKSPGLSEVILAGYPICGRCW